VIARDPKSDTALDRVAGALSSEAARTELYRYASSVAEHMPPDASSWYVVGANIQVNAVTRRELTTLAAEAKKGGTILAGFYEVAARMPKLAGTSLLTAAVTMLLAGILANVFWHGGYDAGWGGSQNGIYATQQQLRCQGIAALRHELVAHRDGYGTHVANYVQVKSGCAAPVGQSAQRRR
jgi:hypothetical protein